MTSSPSPSSVSPPSVSRLQRDLYYRASLSYAFRSRSAFKLIQILEGNKGENRDLLQNKCVIVDCCSAPGGWSYVCNALLPLVPLLSIDLFPLHPFSDPSQSSISTLQADITHESTLAHIATVVQSLNVTDGRGVLLLCDGSPDVLGLMDRDEYFQHSLLISAIQLAINLFRSLPSSSHRHCAFVGKVYRAVSVGTLLTALKDWFSVVMLVKPRASRNSSIEAFIICKQYSPTHHTPHSHSSFTLNDPHIIHSPLATDLFYRRPMKQSGGGEEETEECDEYSFNDGVCSPPYVSVGGGVWCDWDSDRSFPIQFPLPTPPLPFTPPSSIPCSSSSPVFHSPISPPYAKSLALKRANQLTKHK